MMKKIFIKNILVAMVIVITATNCSDGLKDLNVNPTAAAAQNFNANFLLSTSQLRYTGSADFSYETWRAQLIYFSTIVQHFSTTIGYWAGDKYTVNPGYNFAYFERAYDEQVKFVVDGLEVSKDKPELSNLYNALRIWKVVIFHRLTDIYGDVPYFEAGKGYYTGNYTPTYDTQDEIYTDMLKELDEATSALVTSGGDTPTGDMTSMGGDVSKWKKFGYSMMLRLAMRVSNVAPQMAQQYAEKAAAGGVMSSIADNVYIMHDATGGRPTVNRISNVFNENSGERAQVKWSSTFIDFLADNDDPRLSVVADVPALAGGAPNYTFGSLGNNDPDIQIGMPNGYNLGAPVNIAGEPNYPGAVGSDVLGNYSRPRAYLLKLNGPTFIMTYAEVELLLAEAKKNGWNIPGTTADHYNAGVRAAMAGLAQFDAAATISSGDIDAYLADNPYVDEDGYEMIGWQYWAATIFNDYESFSNWRRTGFPQLTPVNHPNGGTGGVIPRRMLYPTSEAANNPANYADAVGRLGGNDSMLERVWWDVE